MNSSTASLDFKNTIQAASAEIAGATNMYPSPADWRDVWIYFLMVDRFCNPTDPPRHNPFDDPGFFDYQGGKFSGVQEKLSYIKQLGAGAIWLSPVLKNLPFSKDSYHGYGIHDFMKAEPRFAETPNSADTELRALVDAAHTQGLYVIFDIVLNHTGDVFAYECAGDDTLCIKNEGSQASQSLTPQSVRWRQSNGEPLDTSIPIEDLLTESDAFVWPSELQRNEYFRRSGTTENNDTTGDFASLKQIVTESLDVQNQLIAAYQYVIAKYDVDGFRIDTLRYLKGDFARIFGNAIREFALSIGKKNFFTFGEVWSDNSEVDIASFIGKNTKSGGECVGVDAALDYPLFNSLKPVIKGFAAPSAVANIFYTRKSVEQFILSSHGDATRFFVTFLDNHDVKERLRYFDPANQQVNDDQVIQGIGSLFTLPGIACIYYGTEQGLHGRGSDPAVREALWGGPGFNADSIFYTAIEKLSKLRQSRPELRYGRFYFRPISGNEIDYAVSETQPGILSFSRILNNRESLVLVNCSNTNIQSISAIIDQSINPEDSLLPLLYSNKNQIDREFLVRRVDSAKITQADLTYSEGSLHVINTSLQSGEIKVIGSNNN